MPDVHLTDEQLTQFRDGVLWNPVVVSHLQSCGECQNRLREARLLRVLLAQPEKQKSAHPSAEDLAAYLEGNQGGMPVTRLEAHVAGCPECFVSLTAIRDQFRPASTSEEVPPDWVVVRAARDFHPPETRLNLGTLFVHWLDRIGPLLRLIPPSGQRALGILESRLAMMDVSSEESRPETALPSVLAKMSVRAYSIAQRCEPTESHGAEEFDEVRDEGPEEVGPIDFTIGYLNVRLTPQGRTRDQMGLALTVTRTSDNAPVPGVQLSLEGDEGPHASTTTGDDGIAKFSLPQGQARLVFLSPVSAELQISF
jgi:hypothetical protein